MTTKALAAYRAEVAKAALLVILDEAQVFPESTSVAKAAVAYADALIAELTK
jgi:hypothetical protein